MAKKIGLVLDDELAKKLKILQLKKNLKSTEFVSFSSVVNDVLRKSFK